MAERSYRQIGKRTQVTFFDSCVDTEKLNELLRDIIPEGGSFYVLNDGQHYKINVPVGRKIGRSCFEHGTSAIHLYLKKIGETPAVTILYNAKLRRKSKIYEGVFERLQTMVADTTEINSLELPRV